MCSWREAFAGSSWRGSGALPASAGAEARGAFPAGLLFLQRVRFIWEGQRGEKPSLLRLLGKEPLADSSSGRLEGCAEASSCSAAQGGWVPPPCSGREMQELTCPGCSEGKGEAVVCCWPVAQAQLRGISLREAPRTLSPVRQCRKHGLRWQRWWKRGSEEKLGHSPGSCRGRGEGAGSLPGAGGWRCPRGGRRCRRARVVLA